MHGVVSLLDDEHYALVEEIWDELARTFDVRGIYVTPFPHFSYQVAEGYDVKAVETFLQELAARSRPFRVRAAGLAVFTLASPVLYVPLVRSPALSALHGEIWDGLAPTKPCAVTNFYHPELWVPHITLAHKDIDRDSLAEIVRLLSARNLHWEMTVNNLSIIYDTGTEQGLHCRFNFTGTPGADDC
ncbi:MAG TPA: 2'-5' RNA ligase family protein [Pyrinomonadaceae bacterium]|jgi:2'-5' RNA ligase|nr:2'-5' RNA ligase family protein [Pyrinomonadaceae bacterium]